MPVSSPLKKTKPNKNKNPKPTNQTNQKQQIKPNKNKNQTKKTQQNPITNKTHTGSQGGMLVITIFNFLLLVILVLLTYFCVWIELDMNSAHKERTRKKGKFYLPCFLYDSLCSLSSFTFLPWVTQYLCMSRSELQAEIMNFSYPVISMLNHLPESLWFLTLLCNCNVSVKHCCAFEISARI